MKAIFITSAVWLAIFGAVLVGGRLPAFGVAAAPPAGEHTLTATPTPGPAPVTHEQMHQMMDAMHGSGTSQRMHEAMGPDAEQMMDQCVSMMSTMQSMQGMMGGGTMGSQQGMGNMMPGVMNGGMMGPQGQSMGGMMGPKAGQDHLRENNS